MGRLTNDSIPRKCTKRFLQGFRKLLLAGVPAHHSARTLGIGQTTFYYWLELVEAHNDGEEVHSSIVNLAEILSQARSEAIAHAIVTAKLKINTTSDALKFLEKIAPDEFGPRATNQAEDVEINATIVNIVKSMNERNALNNPEDVAATVEGVDVDL